ncbi:MAG: acriflavin resistance protein [Gammaproteobacteria bacterium]|nr:acriflavin resistance protein [Gammaproteobacteria bacterium]OUT96530.1 MAG: acriflavin resistance protein [Gammaproteobacteria bacterium TMED36]
MSLPEVSVRRFVFAVMINLVIVLFGLISVNRISIDRSPDIDFSLISVTTILPGANPDVVDSSVTNIIESSVNSIPGIDDVRSRSAPGVSNVFIQFLLEKDLDIAFNEVQSKVGQINSQLPDDAETPIISKIETGEIPIIWLALRGNRTLQDLSVYAKNTVKRKLETINGVGSVVIGGEQERNIRVNLDFDRMSAFGITVQDIVMAFKNEHIKLPGGFLIDNSKEDLLKLDLESHNVEEIENIIVTYDQNRAIKLKDIAEVKDDVKDLRSMGRFNGDPSIGIGVTKIRGENTVEIIEKVKTKIKSDIEPTLPAGMTLDIGTDDSSYIYELISGLGQNIFIGFIVASLIVLLFLRSYSSMAIVSITIPVSLFGAVFIMYAFGLTLNTMTMLALLLLIGIVVDDAIVVLENAQRNLNEDTPEERIRASIIGANEVFLPIVSSTLVLVALFTVVFFMEGIAARFFRSFGVVVSTGVLVSTFVALTLTPTLASKFLKTKKESNRIFDGFNQRFNAIENRYREMIEWSLSEKKKVLSYASFFIVLSFIGFTQLSGGFFPEEDEGQFTITVKTPVGTGIDYTNDRLSLVERLLEEYEDIESYFTIMGSGIESQAVNIGVIYVRLMPSNVRSFKQYELIPILRERLNKIPGIKAFPAPMSFASGTRGEAMQFTVSGPDLNILNESINVFLNKLAETPELGDVDSSIELNLPQVSLEINRELASEMGLSTRLIAEAANIFAGGIDVARFNDAIGDGERYKVRLKGEYDMSVDDLDKIYLRTPSKELVRLDTVAQFKETVGPSEITRLDRMYSAYFYSDPTTSLSNAIQLIEDAAADTLPVGYEVGFFARAKEFKRTSNEMLFAFLTGLILVYMVLASQFNSFRQPLIVMISQPLAVIGGTLGIWIVGSDLNIFSMTGLVLLTGLVAKNSILLIDRTNQEREKGLDIDEALLSACPRRLRPILMTSLTLILAMMMPALGIGSGVELSQPLAIAIVGGMISSTFLTLVIIPIVYSSAEKRKQRKRLYNLERSASSSNT